MREIWRTAIHAAGRLVMLLQRVGLAEKRILIALFLTAVSLYGFVEVAEDMLEGDTKSFDRAILLAFRNPVDPSDPIGPAWLEEVMRDITALGGMVVLATVTSIVVGFLVLIRQLQAAWMIVMSVTLGVLLSHALKWGFARPRPELVTHATSVYTQSFPSAHAMLSAVVYLTLGALLARTQAATSVKLYLIAVAAGLTVMIGMSRVYLGVHWPSDVLAGWAIGAAWALVCWTALLWVQGKTRNRPVNLGQTDQ